MRFGVSGYVYIYILYTHVRKTSCKPHNNPEIPIILLTKSHTDPVRRVLVLVWCLGVVCREIL